MDPNFCCEEDTCDIDQTRIPDDKGHKSVDIPHVGFLGVGEFGSRKNRRQKERDCSRQLEWYEGVLLKEAWVERDNQCKNRKTYRQEIQVDREPRVGLFVFVVFGDHGKGVRG